MERSETIIVARPFAPFEKWYSSADDLHIVYIAGGLLVFRSGAAKIAVEFRELEISVDGSEARVEGWIDYSGTEATWPRYKPTADKFIAHLEKTDGKWLFSRIKVL